MLWKLMQRQQQIMDSRNRRTPALTAQYCKDFQYWTTWSSLLLINISNVCDRVWHTGLFYKLKSYGISSRIFSLILSFLSNRQLRVVLDGKSSREFHLMLEFFKAKFLVLHFSYKKLMTFLMILSAILLSMLVILFSSLSVIGHLICCNN